VVESWRATLTHRDGPVALALTRQKVAVIDRAKYGPASGVAKGAYVLADAKPGKPAVILMGSGSEVELVLGAYEKLAAEGVAVRAVSMPSMEFFAQQPQQYRDSVLPPGVAARVAVEAAVAQPWYRWVGDRGAVLGIERFGTSAPAPRIYQEYGLTVDNLVKKAKELLGA
jgi:transketolase